MTTAFLFFGLLFLLLFVIFLILFLIWKLRKKTAKKLKIAFLSSLLAAFAFIVAFFAVPTKTKESEPVEIKIQTEVDLAVADLEEPLEIEYYNDLSSVGKILVYDADYLDMIFGSETVAPEMLHTAIDDNPLIGPDFKPYFHEYVDLYVTAYPEADLRILYHNLLSLEVVECEDEWELLEVSWSLDSYACYVQKENRIYVMAQYEYIKETWEYQVLMHEISHAARSYVREAEEMVYKAGVGLTSRVILSEALNSVFTVCMFDYEERDIGYQLASNYLLVMLDCMDNYTLSDYINHSQSYFLSKLDEASGHINYAAALWDLIELQREDYLDMRDNDPQRIQIPQEEYYPIYDLLCDMYYSKYTTPNMTTQEISAVADRLVDMVTFDVPEGYDIPAEYFHTAAQAWSAALPE